MADPTVLFTAADARLLRPDLSPAEVYPSERIEALERQIRAFFAQACGVSFIPVSMTDALYDGSGSDLLRLDHVLPYAVSALSVGGTAFTAEQLADVKCYAPEHAPGYLIRAQLGSFAAGRQNVSVSYKHGYQAVPADVQDAALTMLCKMIIPSDVHALARSYSDGVATYQLGYAGAAPHWTGIDDVDAVLQRYWAKGLIIG